MQEKVLDITLDEDVFVTIHLPEVMNFCNEYEVTALYVAAIRRFTKRIWRLPRSAYRLKLVDFDNLKDISTSAALVLTAELSRWDDSVRRKLIPNIDKWDCDILKKFTELGFFDLFKHNPVKDCNTVESCNYSGLNLVRYIKGRCGDKSKTRTLKENISVLVGEKVNNWTFLDSGLSEAITNVSHHAYPKGSGYLPKDKNWYLSGSYNDVSKELKVVFYDQGDGIPKTLPYSDVREKISGWFSMHPFVDKKKHEFLLKAAMGLDRTSTKESDRGKGLQDLLEFVKHRKNGYLLVLSLKGLYKFSIKNGEEKIESRGFDCRLDGTLITWSVVLGEQEG